MFKASKLEQKQMRKSRSLQRNLERAEKHDQRTAKERGYDAAVKTGVARAQAGSCIASIVGNCK